MTTPDMPIYIDQGNGSFKKYNGTIEVLRVAGWPEFAPAGTLPPGVHTTSAALDRVFTKEGVDAALLTHRELTEELWKSFEQFIATECAD